MLLLLLNTQLGRKMNLTLAEILSIYRNIFGFNEWESVKSFICGLGRLDFHHILDYTPCEFYFHISHVKHTLMNNMFWVYSSSNHSKDCDLAVAGFKCRRDLCCDIYEHFRLLCF